MDKKQQILEAVKQDPFISQKELAEKTGLSRSAAAGYISTLIKEGVLAGKAYVVNEPAGVFCLGGANLDRKLTAKSFQMYDSNPVISRESPGGVARNICVNLNQLGQRASLVTVTGFDAAAEKVTAALPGNGHVIKQLRGASTGTYTVVLNEKHDMLFALADMAIYDAFTPEVLEEEKGRLKHASVLAADTNLPEQTLCRLAQWKLSDQKLVLIPVSAAKMDRVPQNLAGYDLIVLNKLEAEALTKGSAESLLDLGVAEAVVTDGLRPVQHLTADGIEEFPVPASERLVDVTGAGDAFASVLIKALAEKKAVRDVLPTALHTAKKVVESEASSIQLS
ncbi:PfkB family carbohydrate kinase [Alkalicoccus luteus]|uniref:Winged helix-turn-helix transcriptional regulator n=1 Tax=Alkalicoccus luteus TaxID=1237094 RepID=A0A969PRI1_9BACI|nr:PfkB family carbohydrate kinase [Alkalicoccus luteus]NJP36633.1 winged helix-turn-helix transcriptional regulator [Alkalicoccus luteus]